MLLLTGFPAMNGYAEQARLVDWARGDPEIRLKLRAEIRKRISRTEVSFDLDGFQAVCDVYPQSGEA
jgi:hypothetical protein